eukprot:12190157-Prorocentrum_lima.AAC.1
MARWGMPGACGWCGRASALLVASVSRPSSSMPRDHASVCVALQCRRASSRAIRAVPTPSKRESSATVSPGVGGCSGPLSLLA